MIAEIVSLVPCHFTKGDLAQLYALSERMCKAGMWAEVARVTPTEGPGGDTWLVTVMGCEWPTLVLERHADGRYWEMDGQGEPIQSSRTLTDLLERIIPFLSPNASAQPR